MFYLGGGSTFHQIGTGFTFNAGVLNAIDLNMWLFGGSGTLAIYRAGHAAAMAARRR